MIYSFCISGRSVQLTAIGGKEKGDPLSDGGYNSRTIFYPAGGSFVHAAVDLSASILVIGRRFHLSISGPRGNQARHHLAVRT